MQNTDVKISTQKIDGSIFKIMIGGEVNAFAEGALMEAYAEANAAGAKTILLDFSDLEYMNSSGIGLLVTLLIRVSRNKQKLMAFGLSQHYRQIFTLTRLHEAIALYDSEELAVNAAA